MKPLSQTLTELIVFTEEVVTKPARHHGLAADLRFSTLAQEIRDADRRPASDGVRCTHAGMAIIACTEGFFAGEMDPGSRWLAAIGALLPALRTETWQQVKNEKAAVTETRR